MARHTYEYSSEAVSDAYLQINSCGREIHRPMDLPTYRPKGRRDYQIIYVTQGVCTAEAGNQTYRLEKGDVLLYKPHEMQKYTILSAYHTETMWVHFTGSGCEELLRECRLYEQPVFKTGDSAQVPDVFEKMLKEFILQYPFYQLQCNSHLMSLVIAISRMAAAGERPSALYDPRIMEVLERMHKDYAGDLDMDLYASMCHVSKDRFLHIFKASMGISPHRYQTNLRIEKAKELLRESPFNVSETAQFVGYSDICYFSRIFKKYTGSSPAKYK